MEKARMAPQDDTVRLFLDLSFSTWFAYFLANSTAPGQRHYSGHKTDRNTLDAFEKLSVQQRKMVAARLQHVNIDTTIQNAIARMDRAGIRSKRRRKFIVLSMVVLV
jgi:hypothetical protein